MTPARRRSPPDYLGQFTLRGLEADADYWHRVVADSAGGCDESRLARFRTAPHPDQSVPVPFTWGDGTGQGMADRPAFPAFGATAAEAPAFLILHGDTIYGEVPILGAGRQAVTDHWPVSSRQPTTTYRTLRWGRELELFVRDTRQSADPLDKPDGPDKTMLGERRRR